MKALFAFISLITLSLSGMGQEYFRLNERLNDEKISPEIKVIGEENNQIVAIRGIQEKEGKDATFYIDYFDNFMQRSKRVKLQEEYEKARIYPINGFILEGRVYLLVFFKDKDSKKYEFYVWEVDKTTGEYVPSRRKLASIEADDDLILGTFLPLGKQNDKVGNAKITLSEDRSYFLVSLWFETNKYVYMGLYDNKAELLKSKRERRAEIGNAAFELESILVTNAGNFYISKPSKPRNRRGVEGIAVTNAIVGYTNFGNEKLEMDIMPVVKTDVKFTPLHITQDEKGHLHVYSFYLNQATYAIEGVFNAELNPLTLAMENENYIPIKTTDFVSGNEAEWLQQLIRGRNEKMSYHHSFINIRQIDFTPDGQAQIFAEIVFDAESVTGEEMNSMKSKKGDEEEDGKKKKDEWEMPKDYSYTVSDKIIVRIDPKNELKWVRRLPYWYEVETGARSRTHAVYFFDGKESEVFFTGDLEMFKSRRTEFKVKDLKQAVMLRAVIGEDGRWKMNYYTFNRMAPAEVIYSGEILPNISLESDGGYALPVYNQSKGGTMMIQVPKKMPGFVF